MVRDDDDDDDDHDDDHDEGKLCLYYFTRIAYLSGGDLQIPWGSQEPTVLKPSHFFLNVFAKVQADRFMTDFMETLAHEQPVMTARLMEVIMADSEGNYSLDFPDWLLNFSMLDLHDRTGREDQGNVTHGLLLTQSISYTDNMKKRSLPSSFDSRSHWSSCGEARVSKGEAPTLESKTCQRYPQVFESPCEVIGRIHNQGTCGSLDVIYWWE